MVSEEQLNQAKKVAEKLMDAYAHAVCANYIASDTGDLSSEDVCLLREVLQRVEGELNDVLMALIAGKIIEMMEINDAV